MAMTGEDWLTLICSSAFELASEGRVEVGIE